jgi:hypothetical protein
MGVHLFHEINSGTEIYQCFSTSKPTKKMPHPIQVEITFRELMLELEQTTSMRQRFTLIRLFIRLLSGEYKKYDSYLIQLAEEIPVYSGPTTYSGLNPALLDQDIQLFLDVSSRVAEMYDSEKFRLGLDRLRQVCILQYGHAGALKQAVRHLNEWLGTGTGPETDQIQYESFANEEAGSNRLHRILMNRLETGDLNAAESQKIRELCDELEDTVRQREGSALVPVVELHDSEPDGSMVYGRLLRITVVVKNEHDKEKDLLTRRFTVAGGEQALWPEGDVITEAARSLMSDSETRLHNKRFHGEVDCELKGAVHEGNSVNTAISALWYTSLQRFTNQRSKHEISSNICISGDLKRNGTLIPVDANSISLKAEAAFFSWCKALVVSSGQLEEFKTAVNNLQKRYPGRHLIVLGIDHLHELFFDRRLTIYINPSKFKYAVHFVWQNKFEAAGILTIFLLLTIIFRLVYGPLDKNPALAKFSGEILEVQNESGNVIDEIRVGHSTVDLALTENYPTQRRLVTFSDLNGDGKNDIIWGEIVPGDGNKQYGFIRSKEVQSNHTYWSFPLRYDFEFPFKPEVIDQNYLLSKLWVEDFHGHGSKSLILSMEHSLLFPGILSLRDAYSGDEISHFVNTGRIWDFYMADITGNGRKEVIFSGFNNAYNSPFLGVLDIDQIQGQSPASEEYLITGYEVPPDIRYILLPSVASGRSFLNDTLYNQATQVDVMEDDQIIRVRVYDISRVISNTDPPFSRSYIEFYFHYDLSPRGNSTYIWQEQAAWYSGGHEERGPASDYRSADRNQKKLLHWNGEHFAE